MKVLNLRCANGHGFEGWFANDEEFMAQNGSGHIECPLCADRIISRMPSAPRLNLRAASAQPPEAQPAQPAQSADMQALWLQAVRHMMDNTQDVGERFAEEARRMHYGEAAQRGIRGQATLEERQALHEEGIETLSLPVPAALKGPVQ